MKIASLAVTLALGLAAGPARVASDRPDAADPPPSTYGAVIPPEPPQPDPVVEARIAQAAAELAAAVERDKVLADLRHELGRLDAVITLLENTP